MLKYVSAQRNPGMRAYLERLLAVAFEGVKHVGENLREKRIGAAGPRASQREICL